jgi:heme exporter protein C
MLKLLKQWWWKILAIALVLYSTIAGFYIPLSSGISAINPEAGRPGAKVSLTITGYNTHFASIKQPNVKVLAANEVLLKNDLSSICASSVEIIDDNNLLATFDIPADLKVENPNDLYNVIVSNPRDGTFFIRNAFSISRDGGITAGMAANCPTDIKASKPASATFPNREILYETIRNLYFHVPMWFTMIMLLIFSFGSSIAYLNSSKEIYDIFAKQTVITAMLFGTLGIITGMIWAKNTWGAYWVNDPRLNGAAVGMLVYLAYLILRNSLTNEIVRARVSAVYSIFAFVIYIVFIFVIPRMNDTLHPGAGGNPAFSNYDLDSTMRMVFYPACLGFILTGFWIASILIRADIIDRDLKTDNSFSR